jgi:glycosyltransferase involved in cell wall biosynthesis
LKGRIKYGEQMRVLLSAYACEPNKGSEQEVGWQRALHMRAFADEVWVLTRANNQKVIEADPASNDPGLHFIYYDLPSWALRLKKKSWFLYFYFTLWQWGAYGAAARQHRITPFDRVYHVTFVSVLAGSLMGRLGIPFVVGPIAGGERAPLRLRRSMPLRGKASELLRDVGIFVQRCSPLTRSALSAAERIYVATPDSLRLIPFKWRAKTMVHLAVATHGIASRSDARRRPDTPRFIFAGNLHFLKGVQFAIRALDQVRRAIPNATLTLVGDGPAEGWLRTVASRCGVYDAVEFAGRLPRDEVIGAFRDYTALVFPSLHDSGGLVVLEALSDGLPVVCLDLGGPGIIMNETCGIVVSTAHADEAQIVTSLANAMISLATMANADWERLSMGAVARSNELSWAKLTEHIVGQGSST